MNTREKIIELKDIIVKRGGVCVLEIPALSLSSGESVAIIGPNGSGKTSLLLAAARLIKPERGRILFRGNAVSSGSEILAYRRRTAMVFQEPLLLSGTVYGNVASGLRIRGLGRSEIADTAGEFIERFHLGHLSARTAKKLSGGEAQRTCLARAFATRPDIIFLDEPFSSLDTASRESLIYDFKNTLRDTGTTAVMVTHERAEALMLADRIAVMDCGRIAGIGKADVMLNNPVNEFAASFAGMETVLMGKILRSRRGSVIVLVGGREIAALSEAAAGETVALCVRPENVALSAGKRKEATSVRNSFKAKIVSSYQLGFFRKIHLDCGFPLVSFVTRESVEKLELEAEKIVTASFKATAVHVIRKG